MMRTTGRARLESALDDRPDGTFSQADLDDLPEPAQRHLRAAIAPGTAVARSVRIEMSGQLRVGRWLPFRAQETLAPHRGFVWAARVAWLLTGSDQYMEGRGELDWRLAGLIRIAHADGPDVSRSAAERAAGEAVWLPTALLPRFGVTWDADGPRHLRAGYAIDGFAMDVRYELNDADLIRSVAFERWGDPDDSDDWRAYPFGGEFTSHATWGGLTIPSAGRLGWHYGTAGWPDGEFFRFQITDLRPALG